MMYGLVVGKTALTEFYKKKKGICPDLEGNAGLTIVHENGFIIVWIDDTNKSAINTLIHEGVHVFQNIMEFIGEDKPGKEVEAYTIADIVENLIQEYVKVTNKEPDALPKERSTSVQNWVWKISL